MGFSRLSTLLLTVLSYVFQAVFVLVATIGSTMLSNTRTYWMSWGYLVSLAGAIMVRLLPAHDRWSRFIGYCLLLAYTSGFPLIVSMVTSNTGGFTKKMTVNSMVCCSHARLVGVYQFELTTGPIGLHCVLRWQYHRPTALLRARGADVRIWISRHACLLRRRRCSVPHFQSVPHLGQ